MCLQLQNHSEYELLHNCVNIAHICQAEVPICLDSNGYSSKLANFGKTFAKYDSFKT